MNCLVTTVATVTESSIPDRITRLSSASKGESPKDSVALAFVPNYGGYADRVGHEEGPRSLWSVVSLLGGSIRDTTQCGQIVTILIVSQTAIGAVNL